MDARVADGLGAGRGAVPGVGGGPQRGSGQGALQASLPWQRGPVPLTQAAPAAAQGAQVATGVPASPQKGSPPSAVTKQKHSLPPAAGRLVLVGADVLAGADGFGAAPVAAHTELAAARPVRALLAAPALLPYAARPARLGARRTDGRGQAAGPEGGRAKRAQRPPARRPAGEGAGAGEGVEGGAVHGPGLSLRRSSVDAR